MCGPSSCDTNLCRWLICFQRFKQSSTFETSGTVTSVTWLHIPEDSIPQPQTNENFTICKYLTNRTNHCTELLLILQAASVVMQTYVLAGLRTQYATQAT